MVLTWAVPLAEAEAVPLGARVALGNAEEDDLQTTAFGTWTPWVPQKVLANFTAVFWSSGEQTSARQQAMLSMKEVLAQMHLASS